MRKLIAAINMTLDGFCDHTAMIADDELHQHYSDLLASAGVLIYGRITYQLMESAWPEVVKNLTGNKSLDQFAITIDELPKVVFSRTLKDVGGWKTARLAKRSVKEEIAELKRQPGKDIVVGSRSLIVNCLELGLVDEFQLCIHPVVVGSGLPLFKGMSQNITFELSRAKTFGSGAVVQYYLPVPRI